MVRAGSSPGGPRSVPAAAWFLPAAVTAVVTVVAALVVQVEARAAVIWCGAVATLAVAVLAAEVARRGAAAAAERARHAEREEALSSRLIQQEAATTALAQQLLPEAVERLQEGEFAEDVLLSMESADERLSAEFRSAHRELLRSVVQAVQAEETLRDSAQRGVVNIARRVQAVIHQQARDLREMEERHGSRPDFFADLLKLDHGTALIGRLADSIAVLGGARPGRQWRKPVALYSVMRGAMSRITDYQRVELHSVVDVAVTGPAVEPLIHALAELLDNATRYSPPKTKVHLTASEVHAGVAIEIEDGGVGLSEEARSRAEQMLKEAHAGIDLNDLGEAPRLGLAVVGRLARAYDFQVSLPPSAYGGVRAVLVVPSRTITTAPVTVRAHGIGAAPADPSAPVSASEGVGSGADAEHEPRRAAPAAAEPAASGPPSDGGTSGALPRRATGLQEEAGGAAPREEPVRNANGLPQRRRRRQRPAGRGRFDARGPASPPEAEGGAAPPEPGMWMADLASGLSGEGRTTSAPRNSSTDTTSDEGE
ncbi:sensor histidine kinase [Streptomyces sp. TR06-5]|uniref:sensor histidine kinase n=1 Tax=unclassified Streptomyces TaxID=2593676 RepID=UPI00399FC714